MSIADPPKRHKIKEKRPFLPFSLTKVPIELVIGIAANNCLLS